MRRFHQLRRAINCRLKGDRPAIHGTGPSFLLRRVPSSQRNPLLHSTIFALDELGGSVDVESGQPMSHVGHHFFEELIGQRHLDVDFLRLHVGPRHLFRLELTRDQHVDHVVALPRVNPQLRLGISTRRSPRRRRMLRVARTAEGTKERGWT